MTDIGSMFASIMHDSVNRLLTLDCCSLSGRFGRQLVAGFVLTVVVLDSSSKSFKPAMSGVLKKPSVWQSLRLLNSMSDSPMEFFNSTSD